MSKRLYVAYGSNLNIRQMKYRCPTAKLYGTGVIEDYELQFKGNHINAYATIAPKEGASVPAAVWEIQPKDEKELDRYEGYPSHYFKQDVPVKLDNEEVDAMVYIMNLKMDFGIPSSHYYRTVYEGYSDCGFPVDVLSKAVTDSAKQFYSSVVRSSPWQGSYVASEEDGCEEENLEDDEMEDEELDESGTSYFDGMQM